MSKKFPDTEAGVREMIAEYLNPEYAKEVLSLIKTIKPDPWVNGVWGISFKSTDSQGNSAAICYLAGYSDLKYNDIEFGENNMIYLKDVLPKEFTDGEYDDCKAFKFAYIEVISSKSFGWIGKEKNVSSWFILANWYAVGFNENTARGWSFPVIKIR